MNLQKLLLSQTMLMLFLVGALFSSAAAEETASPPAAPPTESGRSRFAEARERLAVQLKEKFPQEYAELEQLQQNDRRAAMRKMMELAQKAGLEIPFGAGRNRGPGSMIPAQPDQTQLWQEFLNKIKEKFPTEYEEVAKLLQTDPNKALEKLKELAAQAGLEIPEGSPEDATRIQSPRNRNRFMVARAERILRREEPEKYAQWTALRKTDPDAAREFFRNMVQEAGLTLDMLNAPDPHPQRVEVFAFSDKDLEEQYSQQSTAGSSNRNYRNYFRGPRGGFPPPPPQR